MLRTQRHTATFLAVVVMAAVAACGGDTRSVFVTSSNPATTTTGVVTTTLDESSTTTTTAATTTAPPASGDDLRFVDGGPLGTSGSVRVTVRPGDMSLLVHARAADSEGLVFVTAVIDPSGADVGSLIGLEYGELSNSGEAAVYLPIRDDVDLVPGEYRIDFEATVPIVSSGAIVRSGDPDAAQVLDVVFWMVTTVEYDRTVLADRFRAVGTDVFGPHDIAIGDIRFVDPPAAMVERHAVIRLEDGGSDGELRALCRDMTSSIGAVRALNFAIVDRLDGGDPDAVIEGSSSGLPGTALLTGSDLGCVAGMAEVDPDFGNRDLLDRAVVVWHEAAHHLGLYHTTEADGTLFDLFDDTPECHADDRDSNRDGWVDLFECAGLDGENFMFHDGDGTVMTADQAWMLRRHPLLRPAP